MGLQERIQLIGIDMVDIRLGSMHKEEKNNTQLFK